MGAISPDSSTPMFLPRTCCCFGESSGKLDMRNAPVPKDEALDLGKRIPTKDQVRDPAELRALLGQWLGRLVGDPGLQVTAIDIPRGAGVANETLLMTAEWTKAGNPRTGEFVARIDAPDP